VSYHRRLRFLRNYDGRECQGDQILQGTAKQLYDATYGIISEHVIGQDKYPVLVVQGDVNIAAFKGAVGRCGAVMIKMGDSFYNKLAVCRRSAEGEVQVTLECT